MIKLISFLHRKEGLSREEFVSYWQNQHKDLMMELKEALRIRQYVQNVPEPGSMQVRLNELWSVPPVCDGIGESWFESEEDLLTLRQNDESRAALERLYEDELRLIDHKKTSALLVRETRFL